MSMTGILRKNEIGRWEYADCELTCGDLVELNIGAWIRGRIEHNGKDYCFLAPDGATAIPLREGLPARMPARKRVWP
ncbi:MAG: DUF5348 domain-containing protein [Elusimicrobia bacterium]|nr:DUF5348 domain-containing protein [Elusimicrobiota bacterium]